MNNIQSTIIRTELDVSGKPIDLQPYFRAIGMPHSGTLSLALAIRWGWHAGQPAFEDPRIIVWATRLVLSGDLLFRSFQTDHGEVRVATVPDSDQPEARDIEFCLLIGNEGGLHLLASEEFPVPSGECTPTRSH